MSVRLFFGYFLALAVCSILAFGSSETNRTPDPDAAEAEQSQPVASFPVPRIKFVLKHAQIARAE